MHFTAFKDLPQRQQTAYLAQHGHLLAEQRQDSFDLRLFACHDYFAEVWRVRDEEPILFIHIFQNLEYLNPYLEKIILPQN